jgi:hypothetical protein
MSFAENSLGRVFNLDLMREIMQVVSVLHGKLALYGEYFRDINK